MSPIIRKTAEQIKANRDKALASLKSNQAARSGTPDRRPTKKKSATDQIQFFGKPGQGFAPVINENFRRKLTPEERVLDIDPKGQITTGGGAIFSDAEQAALNRRFGATSVGGQLITNLPPGMTEAEARALIGDKRPGQFPSNQFVRGVNRENLNADSRIAGRFGNERAIGVSDRVRDVLRSQGLSEVEIDQRVQDLQGGFDNRRPEDVFRFGEGAARQFSPDAVGARGVPSVLSQVTDAPADLTQLQRDALAALPPGQKEFFNQGGGLPTPGVSDIALPGSEGGFGFGGGAGFGSPAAGGVPGFPGGGGVDAFSNLDLNFSSTGGIDPATGQPAGGGTTDVFTTQAQSATDAALAAEVAAQEALDLGINRTENQMDELLATQQDLLDTIFDEKLAKVDEDILRSSNIAQRFAGGAGSARGSRAEGRLADIETQGAAIKDRLLAEKEAELRAYNATVRGAGREEIARLNLIFTDTRDRRVAAEAVLDAAKNNLLLEQQALAAQEAATQIDQQLSLLAEAGLTIDPTTGQSVESLEGQKARLDLLKQAAAIGKTEAQTQQILDNIDNPDFDISFESFGGGRHVVLTNPKTGEVFSQPLGASAASGFGGGGGFSGGGGAGSTGGASNIVGAFDLIAARANENGGDVIGALADLGFSGDALLDAAASFQQENLKRQQDLINQIQGIPSPANLEFLGGGAGVPETPALPGQTLGGLEFFPGLGQAFTGLEQQFPGLLLGQ